MNSNQRAWRLSDGLFLVLFVFCNCICVRLNLNNFFCPQEIQTIGVLLSENQGCIVPLVRASGTFIPSACSCVLK